MHYVYQCDVQWYMIAVTTCSLSTAYSQRYCNSIVLQQFRTSTMHDIKIDRHSTAQYSKMLMLTAICFSAHSICFTVETTHIRH
jgi:hypothetical protein